MNKLLKLPLFLGICGAGCAGVLAGINEVTAPVIEQAKIERANAAYIKMYKAYSVESSQIEVLSVEDDSLLAVGCNTKAIIQNDNVKGVTYTCSTKGYGGTISFQVAFGNGEYVGYTDLGHTETDGYGKNLIASLSKTLKAIKDANISLNSDATYASAMAGKSITGKAIAKVIEVCRVDYLAWYQTVNG